MSIEQYKELAQQEESYPAGTISKLNHYLSILTSWGHTPLEQLLVEDDVTFKSKLTGEYEQVVTLEDIGNIHCLNIPHPLGSGGVDDIPLVLFIHGLGGNFQQFDYQIEYVSKFAQVVALDLPGSGSSTYVKGFRLTLENFSDCVEQLLKHFQVHDKKLILVGHSYGTQVCIKLVNSLPRVETVVFLAPPRVGFKRTWFQSSMLRLFLQVPWLFNLFRKLDRVNNIHSHSLKRLFAPDSEISDFNKFKQFKFNISTNSKNVLTHALSWKPLELEEILEMYSELSKNQKQIVVLDGSQDKVTRDGGSTYRDFLGSQVHYVSLDKTGHNMMLEHPDEINQVLTHVFATCDHRLSREYVDDALLDLKK